ncbi:MAG: DUF1553 domain-containing protein, partial [Blastocatellia bacterium]
QKTMGHVCPARPAPARRGLPVTPGRRLVLSLVVACILLVTLGLSSLPSVAAKGPQKSKAARQPAPQYTTVNDCDYLKDPDSFTEAQARHRLSVSRTTETVGRQVTQTESALVDPANIGRRNYIDQILFDRMMRDGVKSAPLTTDTEFIRRVTLDMTGRIPSPEAVMSFVNDTNPAKRDLLIESFFGTPEYLDRWANFFGDLFKNNAFATNINRYRAGRDAFHRYIRESLQNWKTYDQIATDLITATGDSFAKGEVNFIVGGHVTMGPIQDVYDGYAVHVSQTFLGISSLDCLLCHDGAGHLDAVNLWGAKTTRMDAWGMAAFFARTQRVQTAVNTYAKQTINELATGDYQLNTNSGNRQTRSTPSTDKRVMPKYMLGGQTTINQGESRRQALARLITRDPQFARAIVNYIWEELMVEGLVSPSHSFDPARLRPDASMPEGWTLQPANADLLEALSQEFVRDGYNIHNLIRGIVQSSAYQLSSQYDGEWQLEYVPYYARKFARRLDGEEIHDAIIKATGIMPTMAFNGGANLEGYVMTDDLNNEIYRVTWAMQLPEPVEPRSNGTPRVFMDSFLRGDRDQRFRTRDASILQSLNLMNNSFVMGRIHRNNAGSLVARLLADTTLTNDQIIEKLYLSTLSRQPTATEMTKIRPYFTSLGKQGATEALQWVLLNKVDFMFNY